MLVRRYLVAFVTLQPCFFILLAEYGSLAETSEQTCSKDANENLVCIGADSNGDMARENAAVHDSKYNQAYDKSKEGGKRNDCFDEDLKCHKWAQMGQCRNNPEYMLHNCPKSCLLCGDYGVWGEKQEQPLNGDSAAEETFYHILKETDKYMLTKVFADSYYSFVSKDCKNRHTGCAFWASLGECENNPKFMKLQCAPSCQTCEFLDLALRCPLDKNAKKAWENPGDLNHMFERLITDSQYEQFETVVHSMPIKQQTFHVQHYRQSLLKLMKEEKIKKIVRKQQENDNQNDVKYGPWIITLDNFLTDEECDTLIQLGARSGYKQSYEIGKKNFDGKYGQRQNPGRTSTNAWCMNDCYNHPITKQVLQKMENVTGISEKNSEYLQLLRYEYNQRYIAHHDYNPSEVRLSQGPRILTLYLYLNDVEAGGGTKFPNLGITIMPKKGRALLWPNVLDINPVQKDGRTIHEALPVESGLKFGANAWFHLRDYKGPNSAGCTG